MFRYMLFCVTYIGLSLISNTSYCKDIPQIKAPVVFTGAFQNSITHNIVLYLNEFHEFVLQEEVSLENGKVSLWQTTGIWYQIRNGAFIQLTNENGYERLVNVGGNGDLYLSTQSLHQGHITIPIYKENIAPPVYQLQGDLYISDKNIYLRNRENNISHIILPDNNINEFIESNKDKQESLLSIYADIEVVRDRGKTSVLRIRNIKRISEQKRLEIQESSGVLLDAITGYKWKMVDWNFGVQIPSGAYFFFLPGGNLDIFDGFTHVTGQYVLNGKKISLSASVKAPLFQTLLTQARSLKITGEVLELWGDNCILALFERRL